MALAPTFTPAQAPDTTTELAQQGRSNAESWMNQAQNRQIQQNQDQRAQLQQLAQLPALVAKRNADVAVAGNQIASATAEQQARGKYAPLIPEASQALIDASDMDTSEVQNEDGTPDWEAQYDRLAGLQAKYSVLGLFPDGKPVLGAINDAAARAYKMSTTQSTLKAHMQMTRDMVAGRAGVAQINADTKTQISDTYAAARVEAATLMAQARVAAAKMTADAKGANSPAAVISQLMTTADAYEQKAMESIDDPVTSNGYMQLAKVLRTKAQTFSNPRGDMMLTQPDAAVTPAGGPVKPKGPPLNKPAPVKPGGVNMPTVSTQEQYDDLPPGAVFKTPTGKLRTKPKAAVNLANKAPSALDSELASEPAQ